MEKLIELKELEFDEESHVYKLNGETIPSVTTLMKPLSVSVYGEVDKAILSAAANRGTIVHQAIENYLCYGIEDIPFEYMPYLEAFIKFWTDYKPELIATEYRVYHKYLKYAGTSDLLVIIDGKLWLIDNKTSARVEKILTRIQLEAYKKALATHEIRIEGKAILHLKKNGKYSFVKHELDDIVAWEAFTSSKKVFDYIKTGGNTNE